MLFVDAEGYDVNIINDFLLNLNLRPIIIFEYIHSDTNYRLTSEITEIHHFQSKFNEEPNKHGLKTSKSNVYPPGAKIRISPKITEIQ